MNYLVLDVSMYLGMLLGEMDESKRLALHTRLRETGAYVPSLWWYELTNTLLAGIRHGRLTTALATLTLGSDEYLVIADSRPLAYKTTEVMKLALRHDLSAYEASYLDLALNRRTTLATGSRALRKAALVEKIDVL